MFSPKSLSFLKTLFSLDSLWRIIDCIVFFGSLLKKHIKQYHEIEGYEQQRTPAQLAAGVALMGRRKGIYWGLSEYLGSEIKDTFDDKVNPHWWAAPYISLLYPSGQVGSAT